MRHLKVVLALILGLADCLPAQTGLTSLRGTVTDPTGAVMPQFCRMPRTHGRQGGPAGAKRR